MVHFSGDGALTPREDFIHVNANKRQLSSLSVPLAWPLCHMAPLQHTLQDLAGSQRLEKCLIVK